MNNQKQFKDGMVLMASIFNFDLEEIHIKTYWRLLQGISDEQFESSVDEWLLQGKFFPRPSELLDMIKNPSQSSGEAWAHVLIELRDSQNAKLSTSELQAVNEIGGIEALAHMDLKQLEFKGKEFKAAYKPDRLDEIRDRLNQDPKMKALGELVKPCIQQT